MSNQKLKYRNYNPSLSRVGSLNAELLYGVRHKVLASGLVGRSFFFAAEGIESGGPGTADADWWQSHFK